MEGKEHRQEKAETVAYFYLRYLSHDLRWINVCFCILNAILNVNLVQNLYPSKCTLLVTSLKEVVFHSICLFVCEQNYWMEFHEIGWMRPDECLEDPLGLFINALAIFFTVISSTVSPPAPCRVLQGKSIRSHRWTRVSPLQRERGLLQCCQCSWPLIATK